MASQANICTMRLGIGLGRANALVRLTLRPIEQTLTSAEAKELRDTVYCALREGKTLELIAK